MSLSSLAVASSPKNIIFILADDLGWNDTGMYQPHPIYETPNIDSLASQGLSFTRAYSNSPLCSPTRASILTGQTPSRHGSTVPEHHLEPVRLQATLPSSAPTNRKSISPLTVTRLDTTFPTISSLLKENGYQTAHFGKWHLGEAPFSPLEHGFDIDIPNYDGPGPAGGYLAPWRYAENLQPQMQGEHIDVRLANEAKDWILANHQNGPFFVNFWPFSVHTPYDADPDLVRYFRSKLDDSAVQAAPVYAAMIKQFDDAIGILWEAVIEAGIEKDTIIVFTSDNGGAEYTQIDGQRPTTNFPLRGGKATMYEGSSRVPAFIIWPSLTQPNTITQYPIQSVDFFPSILSGLGIDWPSSHAVDGIDFRFVLSGDADAETTDSPVTTQPVFTYYTAEPRVPEWLPPSIAVAHEQWKLIRTFYYGEENGIEMVHYNQLYNIGVDPGETNNLVKDFPEKLAELSDLIDAHIVNVNAVVPIANPRYVQGSFDYDTIGIPTGDFILEGELPAADASTPDLLAIPSVGRANAGEMVTVTVELDGQPNSLPLQVNQIMGRPLDLIVESSSQIQFNMPEVFVEEFVGFEFSISTQENTLKERVAVIAMPSQSAPTISVTIEPSVAVRGSNVRFQIEATDQNKEWLTVRMESENAQFEQIDSLPASGEFSLPIPQQLTEDSIAFTFTTSDGKAEASTRIALEVVDTLPDSGGGNFTYLALLGLLISVLIKQTGSVIFPIRRR